jgi:uncharacterized protein with WD repeat
VYEPLSGFERYFRRYQLSLSTLTLLRQTGGQLAVLFVLSLRKILRMGVPCTVSDSLQRDLRLSLTNSRVNIIDADTGATISTLPAENVFELGFSPLDTYIITWQRSSQDENGDAVKNLKVWLVHDDKAASEGVDKEPLGRFVQKSQTGWNLQYTYDEKFCARVVTNEVQIYESHDLTKVWNKLRVEGVTDFALSPGENHSVAVFIPERKVNTRGLPVGLS